MYFDIFENPNSGPSEESYLESTKFSRCSWSTHNVNRMKGISLSTRALRSKGIKKSQMSRGKERFDSLLGADNLDKFQTRGKVKP